GVSFESMKPCAMRPATPNACEGGVLDLQSLLVITRLDALAVQVPVTRIGYKPLATLKPGEHFDFGPGKLPQGDIMQARNLVLVQHENTLQLTAFDHGRAGNQQRLLLAARKLGPAK